MTSRSNANWAVPERLAGVIDMALKGGPLAYRSAAELSEALAGVL
jgi:hypothetical protein